MLFLVRVLPMRRRRNKKKTTKLHEPYPGEELETSEEGEAFGRGRSGRKAGGLGRCRVQWRVMRPPFFRGRMDMIRSTP